MNTEYDQPERLEFSWDGQATLRAARRKWLATMYGDFAAGRFDRIAAVMRGQNPRHIEAPPVVRHVPLPVAASSSPPPRKQEMYDVLTGTWQPEGSRLQPWSAYSVAVLGASFPQPGDPDFQPCTGWQAHQHHEALRGKRL